MPRLYLVRHGEPAAAWGEHDDPGLTPKGRAQAQAAALTLFDQGLRTAITSPLKRCRETAAPFEQLAGKPALIEPRVGEIPTPAEIADRQTWLRQTMMGRWAEAPGHGAWRESVVAALIATGEDMVVFSHFVAINVALGRATENDAVTIFRPAHCAISVFETDSRTLRLVSLGEEAATRVN
jgi:broad specificity phosphatase PhoE